MSVPESIVQKIKKLLAFTPENSTREECAIASARAKELLEKYQLSIADLERETINEVVASINIRHHKHLYLQYLRDSLASVFECRTINLTQVLVRGRKRKYKRIVSIIGLTSDVEIMLWLFCVLTERLTDLATESLREMHPGAELIPKIKNDWTKSFIVGATDTIVDRIKKQREKPSDKRSGALVLIKKDIVAREIEKRFPDIKGCMRKRKLEILGRAMAEGQKAGEKISLNKPVQKSPINQPLGASNA